MTAMRTYLAIAEKQLDNPDALVRNLRQQQQLLDRMALITGQLKTFAYRKPERIDPVSLQQVMEQVFAAVSWSLRGAGSAVAFRSAAA